MLWRNQFENIFELLNKENYYNSLMIIRRTLHICIVFSLFFSPFSHASDDQWHRLSDTNFIIYYQFNDSQNSEKIFKILKTSYYKLSQEIGVEVTDTIAVIIAPSKNDYQQMLGKNIPKWSDGVASPSKNSIVLKSASWTPPETDHSAIAVHELIHILLDRAVKGNPIPRWFDEGIAVYYSGEKRYASSSRISKALLTKSLIELKDIDNVLNFQADKAQLAYQESYLAVDYLFKQYGKDAVKKIIQHLGNGRDLNQAFLAVIDLDLWEFEGEWLDNIKQKYRWYFLVELDDYLWVIMLVLLVAGFFMMRIRNRRTIQRWQDEDYEIK